MKTILKETVNTEGVTVNVRNTLYKGVADTQEYTSL